MVIKSLCVNCGKSGETRLLLVQIPHFRDILISSFRCSHCAYNNNDVQSTGAIQEQGQKITLRAESAKDLDRQLIKSDSCSISIPEFGLEIPTQTQKGTLNTIEGFIQVASEGIRSFANAQLSAAVAEGSAASSTSEELAAATYSAMQLLGVCQQLDDASAGKAFPFTVILDDPAGNSYVENPFAPNADTQLTVEHYNRTAEQQEALGMQPDRPTSDPIQSAAELAHLPKGDVVLHGGDAKSLDKLAELVEENFDPANEVLEFPSPCSDCGHPGAVRMLVTNIPHFREIILMAFSCSSCGYKSNEVRGGGGVSPKGKKITLLISNPEDLNRDILKSETAGFFIPSVGLELTEGTLGGKFTTIEGLLQDIQNGLSFNPFTSGDSSEALDRKKMGDFQTSLGTLFAVTEPYTIILDDPLSNSYIQNIYAPDEDPNMTIEEYVRSFEQDETYGLHDINTGDDQHQQQPPQPSGSSSSQPSGSSS